MSLRLSEPHPVVLAVSMASPSGPPGWRDPPLPPCPGAMYSLNPSRPGEGYSTAAAPGLLMNLSRGGGIRGAEGPGFMASPILAKRAQNTSAAHPRKVTETPSAIRWSEAAKGPRQPRP